jgi:hypothetical protein
MTTRIPGFNRLFSAKFNPWVALKVNTTCSGVGTENSFAASSRQAKAVSAADIAAGYPPRPGLAKVRMARAEAAATAGGFCNVVAALSR